MGVFIARWKPSLRGGCEVPDKAIHSKLTMQVDCFDKIFDFASQ